MRDRKRRSKTENGIFRYEFFDQKKKLSHAIGFWRFPSSIFRSIVCDRDLVQKWGLFLIREDGDRKMLRDKIPRRVHGPLTKTKRKHQRYDNTHTKAHRLRPQRHTIAFEGMIVDFGLDNTALGMPHSSVAVAMHHRRLLYNNSHCCLLLVVLICFNMPQ